jgi:hypothetical protein
MTCILVRYCPHGAKMLDRIFFYQHLAPDGASYHTGLISVNIGGMLVA